MVPIRLWADGFSGVHLFSGDSVELLGYLQCADGGAEPDLRAGPFGESLPGDTGLPGARGWAEAGEPAVDS